MSVLIHPCPGGRQVDQPHPWKAGKVNIDSQGPQLGLLLLHLAVSHKYHQERWDLEGRLGGFSTFVPPQSLKPDLHKLEIIN